MFARIRMIFRALFGWMIRSAEDPELLLNQYMEDLRMQVPKFNENVAKVRAVEFEFETQLKRQQSQLAALEPKIVAGVKMGESQKDATMQLMNSKTSLMQEITASQASLDGAVAASAKAMEAKAAFVRNVNAKITEAKTQLGRAKQIQMQNQLNSLMQEFEVGDNANTLNTMTEKLDKQEALAKGRAAVAETSLDSQMSKIENAAADQQATDMYSEYQRQLGLVPDTVVPVKTMDSVPLAASTEVSQQPQVVEGKN